MCCKGFRISYTPVFGQLTAGLGSSVFLAGFFFFFLYLQEVSFTFEDFSESGESMFIMAKSHAAQLYYMDTMDRHE